MAVSTTSPRAEGCWVARFSRGHGGRPAFDVVGARTGSLAARGSSRAVFDGLLYDQAGLLQQAGLEATPEEGAAEVVLRAYLQLGERMLDALRGVFSLIVWDGEREELLCARDQLGIHPLFHAEDDGQLLLSPSVDALLGQPEVAAGVNVPVLVDHLRHRWLNPEETFFRAVRRIPPGHALAWRSGTQRIFRYWDPAPPGESIAWVRADEIDQFDHLLAQAVRRSLSAGRAGIFLSGGLDSVSVAAVAAEATRAGGLPDPWALSLVFPDPSCNEEEVQRNVAAALGLSQVMLPFSDAVGSRGVLLSAAELAAGLAAPLVNLWSPAYDQLALEGKSRGCEVVITGSGGDEWVAVSPYYAADLLRRLDLVGFYRLFHTYRRSYPLSTLDQLSNMGWRFGARPLAKRAVERVAPGVLLRRKRGRWTASIPAWLAPDESMRRVIADRELEAYENGLAARKRFPWSYPGVYFEQVRTGLGHPLVSMEFEEIFEQGRRLGLRFLHPFLDPDLVRFLYRTPPALLNSGGRAKAPLRATVARRLPGLGLERQRKVVATDFLRKVFLNEGRRAWDAIGGIPALADAGVVDRSAADRLVTQLLGGENPSELSRVWDLVGSESWFRARLEQKGR